jgi:hypothetical protein
MLFSGIGEKVVNQVLAALNLPSVDPKTLKKREREAGLAFEKVAHASCLKSIEEERSWYMYFYDYTHYISLANCYVKYDS